MRVLVSDGLRRTRASGYGALTRGLASGMRGLGVEVIWPAKPAPQERDWGEIEKGARECMETMPTGRAEDADIVLQVGTPSACRKFPIPSVIYTQNALGELRSDWVDSLRLADACIVPSDFDRRVFARHLDRVFVAHQSSNAGIFRPMADRRSPEQVFTFVYVGSFSFRKGVDLLLRAFLTEFGPADDVRLVMHCPGAGRGEELNQVIDFLQDINPLGKVRMTGRTLSPEWMARVYQRSDCLITMSRGEGWCMPVTEALLCELPVIAPRSTAMAEYLTEEMAALVPVARRAIGEIAEPFGASFARVYDQPGNFFFEPDVDAARELMRQTVELPDEARARACHGGEVVRTELTWESAARGVLAALEEVLAGEAEYVHEG